MPKLPPCTKLSRCFLSGLQVPLLLASQWASRRLVPVPVVLLLPPLQAPEGLAWAPFPSPSVLGPLVLSRCSAVTSKLTTHKSVSPTLPRVHKSPQHVTQDNPPASSRATWTKLSTWFLITSTLPLPAFLHYFLNFSSLPAPRTSPRLAMSALPFILLPPPSHVPADKIYWILFSVLFDPFIQSRQLKLCPCPFQQLSSAVPAALSQSAESLSSLTFPFAPRVPAGTILASLFHPAPSKFSLPHSFPVTTCLCLK